MTIGFYAGSFDPFTVGHFEIVKKASKLFDKLIIGIGENDSKKRRYDINKMKDAINLLLQNNGLENCECITYKGLTVSIADLYGSTYLIRGLRNGADYDYEENIAIINKEIANIDTLYFRAGKYNSISSSMVVELIKNNQDVTKYLPPEIFRLVCGTNKEFVFEKKH